MSRGIKRNGYNRAVDGPTVAERVYPTWTSPQDVDRATKIVKLREQLDERRRARYFDDPVLWARERLGFHMWSKQAEVAMSLVTHKRIAVRSAHAIGKSALAAVLACWWIDTRPPGEAMVVTTAPSYEQVHSILWEEIRRRHSEGGLAGVVQRSDRWLDSQGRLVGMGRRPPDYNPHAFQGIHRQYVLVLVDESAGIPAWIWTAVDAITTSDRCRTMAIGNPDDNSSTFAEVCLTDPGWKSIRISAFDSPGLTGEPIPRYLHHLLVDRDWVEDKRLRWGEDNPLYQAKVLGEFADSEEGLIALSWVRQAVARHREWEEAGRPNITARRIIGVDVARYGMDKTVLAVREGDYIRDLHYYSKLDTTQTTSLVKAQLAHPHSTAVVDVIGVGAGVLDQLRADRYSAIPFNAGAGTKRKDVTGTWRFPNLRSAAWWNVRELLDPAMQGDTDRAGPRSEGPRLAIPDDDDVIADLTTPTWEPSSGSRLVVESKDSVKKRLGRSTDAGDAVIQSLWLDSPRIATKPTARRHTDAVQWS